MALDWQYGALADGLRCYRNAEFFEAHEHWELVWLGLKEPEKSFVQAIIQTTAAFHHIQAGNRIGGASLLRRALRRFETSPARFAGIEVTRLSTGVQEWLRILESAAPAIPPAVPPIDPTDVPL